MLAALFAGALVSQAQPTLTTIVSNGPPANRVNLVVLAEGYRSVELGQFLVDATNVVQDLLQSGEPYREYSNYFNAFAIAVASVQSGSSHGGAPPNTYFNSAYDASDTIITIPPNFLDPNYSHGQGKVDALLQTFMPQPSLPIVLVNDLSIGGSSAASLLASVGAARYYSRLVVHESGHSLANLGDEYTDPNPGYPDTEEPNTTRQTNRALVKWNAWIQPATPVPTPASVDYLDSVGLFEGAHYHATGWYRPKFDCMMNSMATPFCEVCREALVVSLYERIRPVDGFSPTATTVPITTPTPVTFSLSALRPATHSLSVQWATNGVPVAGATNLNFMLRPEILPNGAHTVTATLQDLTAFVRTDPTNRLRQSLTWNLTVDIPQLRLDAVRWLVGGGVAFRVSGYAPRGFVILGSTNLSAWVALTTNSLSGGLLNYTNTDTGRFSRRYFRAVASP